MGEITKATGLQLFVGDDHYNFGEVGPEDTIEYEIPFFKEPGEIQYIEKGCGCTSALWDEEKKAITGTLEMSKAAPRGGYEVGTTPVNKYVFVWLNDGNPRFIADETKQKVQNPDKAYFKLLLTGRVTKG